MRNIPFATFFLVSGILILLYNLGFIQNDLSNIGKFWPVVLILLGISFLIVSKVIKIIIKISIAIILALFLVAKFTNLHIF
ncbi:MAG TPA: DUF5668 domain-containing protein [Ignavibacteriales bacterium]|nr:DUF5668 domain-containing protein [Ignavibacteriales bacterium]HOL81125.1 DUF5668 domain-containing protein [Ignavibacteriales bacterium]HOM65228.1 DUF5668 domain-containing protein [Ignavibacteriales bacterium]HPD66520.1 DUF5668 domain-containing protein [Ignavibacteriales bacterium]HPP33519.1 DUF5668 domain-containing protein [Ignavibacteriales bacterium]